MGWSSQPLDEKFSKKQFCDYLLDGYKNLKILKRKSNSDGLWFVAEHLSGSQSGYFKKGDLFIGLHILKKEDGIWYEKGLDESSGPYYFQCPLNYLDLVPEKNANWREGVRAYYKRVEDVKKLGPGDKFKLYDNEYEVEAKPSFIIAMCSNGLRYKVPKSQFKDIEVLH